MHNFHPSDKLKHAKSRNSGQTTHGRGSVVVTEPGVSRQSDTHYALFPDQRPLPVAADPFTTRLTMSPSSKRGAPTASAPAASTAPLAGSEIGPVRSSSP